MLQIILLVLLLIIVCILVAGLLMKKEYAIVSEIIINQSKHTVFDYIKYLKNQEHYSKWVMADPNVKMQYTGNDGTVGFKAAWQSEMRDVGIGEQEIIKINDGIGYEVEIRFKKPFEGVSKAVTAAESLSENQTRFTTTFYTKTPFPMNLMIPMIKKMLQKDMDINANNLKNILEAQ